MNKVHIKGNEGVGLSARHVTLSADDDIILGSAAGSIRLDGAKGIFVEVNSLPLARPTQPNLRGQYKLCFCEPDGQIYRVPIPADNNVRTQPILCSSFQIPCV